MKLDFKKLLRQPRKLLTLLLPLALFVAGWYFGLPPQAGERAAAKSSSDETWTCSMHPQIRQPNPGLCPICEMDLIPLQADGGGGIREVGVTPEAAALLDLRVSPVVKAPAKAEVSLFGKVSYDERRVSTITSRIGGRIDRLFVDFTGAVVRKDDHLAEIYSPDIYVAQRELIEANKSILKQGPGTSEAARQTRQRLLSAAREKLRLLQLSENQVNKIASQKTPSDHITIQSPQDGVVVLKYVNEGQYVETGEPLFQVADLSHVWLELEAYESDLPWLRYAQDVTFSVEAVPGEVFHGRVALIDPELDPVTRVAKVRLNVQNKNQLLKPGMFARAEIQAWVTAQGKVIDPSLKGKWISPMHPEIIKDAPGECDICGMPLVPAEQLGFVSGQLGGLQLPLLVPVSAVLRTGERAVVYVRLPEKSDPTFEGREIVVGPRVGHQFIVESGLVEGELVVSKGAFKLDSELQIKAKPSMMSPNAGLEERPASSAPEDLAGQWGPVLRSLARFQDLIQRDVVSEAALELDRMKNAILLVDQSTFQPETVKLWREFSNRLLNAIAVGKKKLGQAPEQSLAILARATVEAGRYLGLPSQPIKSVRGDPALVDALRDLLKAYQPLSHSLVNDDPIAAAKAANVLNERTSKLPLEDSAEKLGRAAQLIGESQKIEVQRKHFQVISNILVSLIREHALDQIGNAYVVHCPMAFDNSGGDWLSVKPEVLNPYFGDAMLRCGSVTATLSLDQDAAAKANDSEMNHQHKQGN